MPINAILEKYTRGRGMERIGVLHKGAKRTQADLDANRPGKDLDHFRVEWAEHPELTTDELDAIFEGMVGRQPKMVAPIFMLGETPDEALSMWFEEWGKSGLYHRCNGAEQVTWFNKATGRKDHTPIACAGQGSGCQCKQVARLNFYMPDFMRRTRTFSYFTLQTHGTTDLAELYATLMDVYVLAGTLINAPFILTRTPKTFELPEIKGGKVTGNRIHVTKSVIALRPAQDTVAALMGDTDDLPQIEGGRQMAALPASVTWTKDQALEWARQIANAHSMSEAQILEALGVQQLSQWTQGATSATRRVNAWISEQLDTQ